MRSSTHFQVRKAVESVRIHEAKGPRRRRRFGHDSLVMRSSAARRKYQLRTFLLPFQTEGIHDTSVDMRFTARDDAIDFGPTRTWTGHSRTHVFPAYGIQFADFLAGERVGEKVSKRHFAGKYS